MAITPCSECGSEISTKAKSCPKCGAVVAGVKVWRWVIGLPVFLFIVALMYGASVPAYKTEAREAREVCYKIAGPVGHGTCEEIYEEALRKGEAKADI